MTAEDIVRLERTLAITRGDGTVQEARVAAGLTLRQAAKLLGLTGEELNAVENDRAVLTPELRARLCELYDVDGFGTAPTGPVLGTIKCRGLSRG